MDDWKLTAQAVVKLKKENSMFVSSYRVLVDFTIPQLLFAASLFHFFVHSRSNALVFARFIYYFLCCLCHSLHSLVGYKMRNGVTA